MTHTKISRLISSRKKVLPRETETVNFFQLGHSVPVHLATGPGG